MGQKYEFVSTEGEEYYKIFEDSIDIHARYPDGRYKAFASDTSTNPIHIFHLRNNLVNGPYLKLYGCGWNIGNYKGDSLWTFLTNPEDTTFKVGKWKEYICGIGIYNTETYRTPFDSNGVYEQTWLFSNGEVARKAVYLKSHGCISEDFYEFETNKVWKQVKNSNTANYSHTTIYQNDSISFVYIVQDGLEISIDYEYTLLGDKPLVKIQVYKESSNEIEAALVSLSIDSNRVLTDIQDSNRQIFYKENEDGNISIEYKTHRGNWKERTLKIK